MPKRKRDRSPEEKIRKLRKRLEKYEKQLKDDKKDQESVLDPFVLEEDYQNEVDNQPEVLNEFSDQPTCLNEIDEQILAEALCETSKEDEYGDEIHPNLTSEMDTILLSGLSKTEKEKLKIIKIPANCKLLDPPKLNLELLGILTPAAKNRDNLLLERQQQLGQSAANIAQAINMLSRKEFSKVEVMKKLGEASRMICHLHFQHTEVRKRLVAPFLDRNLSENLKENKRSEFLYSDLEESVKSFSAIKRASNILKPKITGSKTGNGNNSSNPARPTKNFQPPRRQFQNNHMKRGAYHQRTQQRQTYKSSADSRQQSGPSYRGRAKYP